MPLRPGGGRKQADMHIPLSSIHSGAWIQWRNAVNLPVAKKCSFLWREPGKPFAILKMFDSFS